jgi:predicted deacetylase
MKINISIDDVSPHPNSSISVLDRCFELIDIFPDIKFTLFVPIAYWRTVKSEIATPRPLQIDQFVDFCNALRLLPENNFEICYHGLHHGIPGKSDNDEFQYLTYESAVEKFNLMFSIVKNANLDEKFKMIFRPPAWRMSPGAFDAAEKVGIQLLALSPKDYAQKIYDNKDKSSFWKDKVVYYHANPPFDPLVERETIEIVYHACQWDQNFLNNEKRSELERFLTSSKERIEFCFIKELRDQYES